MDWSGTHMMNWNKWAHRRRPHPVTVPSNVSFDYHDDFHTRHLFGSPELGNNYSATIVSLKSESKIVWENLKHWEQISYTCIADDSTLSFLDWSMQVSCCFPHRFVKRARDGKMDTRWQKPWRHISNMAPWYTAYTWRRDKFHFEWRGVV